MYTVAVSCNSIVYFSTETIQMFDFEDMRCVAVNTYDNTVGRHIYK